MKNINVKKLLILNLPYFILGLYASNLGEAYRLAAGTTFADKLTHLMDGFAAAFSSPLPSFHPVDLLIGLCCGAGLRLAVYVKSKNAKKFRKNSEYGSARWGTHDDIAPYIKTLDYQKCNTVLALFKNFFRFLVREPTSSQS